MATAPPQPNGSLPGQPPQPQGQATRSRTHPRQQPQAPQPAPQVPQYPQERYDTMSDLLWPSRKHSSARQPLQQGAAHQGQWRRRSRAVRTAQPGLAANPTTNLSCSCSNQPDVAVIEYATQQGVQAAQQAPPPPQAPQQYATRWGRSSS